MDQHAEILSQRRKGAKKDRMGPDLTGFFHKHESHFFSCAFAALRLCERIPVTSLFLLTAPRTLWSA
jgi:hypothetical protein